MKRFYKNAAAEACDGGWRVTLDGRAVKTQGQNALVLPTEALAAALAQEWADQGEEIDPAAFVLRDMADYAIDVVAPDPAAAIAELLPYADTDTLCYQADPGEALHLRQQELWEPLLQAAERRLDVRYVRASGVIHQAQAPQTLERIRAVLAAQDPFTLAATKTLSSLSASMVIALFALDPEADVEALWNAANLEEDWQAELWGKDAEAEARRARRRGAFLAAARFAALVRR